MRKALVGRMNSAHRGPRPAGGPLGGSCDRVAGHVLDDSRFLAREFADPVLIRTGAGIEFCRLIYSCLKVCLSSLSCQIGA